MNIQKQEVNRDESGMWTHSEYLALGEISASNLKKWLVNNNGTLVLDSMECSGSEVDVEDWFEHGSCDCNGWVPVCHEEGSFLLSIHDTDDGPVAVFFVPNNLTKTIVSYDSETTGKPNWKAPSGGEDQPHIVQLGAVKCNDESGEVVQSLSVIVKPDGWVIPEETIEVHGITNEHALEHGIDEKLAIQMLLDFIGDDERIAHNKTFDQRIIRIGLKRFFDEKAQDKWAIKDNHYCSMQMARKVIGGKNPKLTEAYKHFTGKELENAHDALADAEASAAVYFGCLKF